LQLPLRSQPLDRRRRKRRPFAKQSSKRQFEVTLGEAVKVKLRQQLAHFLRPPYEQRQQPALEALLQPAHPWPPHLDGPCHHRKTPPLAVPVAVAHRHVHRGAPFRFPPTEKLGELLFEEILDPSLNLDSRQLLQRSPLRSFLSLPSCSATLSSAFLPHGRCPPS